MDWTPGQDGEAAKHVPLFNRWNTWNRPYDGFLEIPSRELTYPPKKWHFESMIFRTSQGGSHVNSLEGKLRTAKFSKRKLPWSITNWKSFHAYEVTRTFTLTWHTRTSTNTPTPLLRTRSEPHLPGNHAICKPSNFNQGNLDYCLQMTSQTKNIQQMYMLLHAEKHRIYAKV